MLCYEFFTRLLVGEILISCGHIMEIDYGCIVTLSVGDESFELLPASSSFKLAFFNLANRSAGKEMWEKRMHALPYAFCTLY